MINLWKFQSFSYLASFQTTRKNIQSTKQIKKIQSNLMIWILSEATLKILVNISFFTLLLSAIFKNITIMTTEFKCSLKSRTMLGYILLLAIWCIRWILACVFIHSSKTCQTCCFHHALHKAPEHSLYNKIHIQSCTIISVKVESTKTSLSKYTPAGLFF